MKILALILCLSLSQFAFAVPVGQGTSNPFESTHQFDVEGWVIGDHQSPFEISLDPGAGPWVKTLEGSPDIIPESTVFILQETLIVGPGLPWADWHEEVLTPGWEWTFGDITDVGNTGGLELLPGLEVSFDPADNPNTIWFEFDTIFPGASIEIWKELHCFNPNGCQGPIRVVQYPTPIPPAVWLFGSGLLGMVGVARRRTQ